MTNFEKYREEILKITQNGDHFGVPKKAQVPMVCTSMSCVDCLFSGYCQPKKIMWLYEEAVDPVPILTVKERGFCEIIRSGYIARDRSGELWIHYEDPIQCDNYMWHSSFGSYRLLNSENFKFITWKSGKAWSIEELLQLEVEE